MKTSIFRLIIISLLFFSCNDKIVVIKNNSSLVYDDDVLTYKNLNRFFSHDTLFERQVKTKQINLLKQELITIRDKAKNFEGTKTNLFDGRTYKYAIIFDEDTLFSNTNLSSWLYKNKVVKHESDLLNKSLLE
ncbi:hypothetical protein KORDIASMS9_00034 [Kordia sp. SMS9]|uniref:hypothetical protein n=1 Tax=Kordia sp. SMS9 TaxID=2282170 RepID=UPI000E0DDA67|nr:hypothetical protein [Kordia sp. SMS9]AXG67852.1 hypothetical protein KORDIASMS9_00034 [Kordia sp. SMS9]